jgi:hypothetical protein
MYFANDSRIYVQTLLDLRHYSKNLLKSFDNARTKPNILILYINTFANVRTRCTTF